MCALYQYNSEIFRTMQIQDLEATNEELEDANTQMEAMAMQATQQKEEMADRLAELDQLQVVNSHKRSAHTCQYLSASNDICQVFANTS